uniref:Uncharacterized protein n=1 Tax=Anopheles coluzzii TaxID=1518534 RepID=A0A8W7P2N7_ANOCL
MQPAAIKLDPSSGSPRAEPSTSSTCAATVRAAKQRPVVRDASHRYHEQSSSYSDELTMNISTEYAPTDGMSRSSYTRSSYRSAYYGGPSEIGGSAAKDLDLNIIVSFTSFER